MVRLFQIGVTFLLAGCLSAQVTLEQSAVGQGSPGTATFSSTPTEGNLLVAVSFHRSAEGATCVISGTGWTEHIERTTELGNAAYRRGLAVYSKVAGASEPTGVTTTWTSAQTNKIVIHEFEDASARDWTFLEKADNDNGTTADADNINTGITASVSAGDHFLFACMGVRHNASGAAIVSDGWASIDLADGVVSNGGANSRDVLTAYGEDTASGTKTSTVTVTDSSPPYDGNTGLSAGILVFGLGEAAVETKRDGQIFIY